jgi:hypothetical protein
VLPAVAGRLPRGWAVADDPEAADAELRRLVGAGGHRVARVTGYPQSRLAGLGGLVAEGLLEELLVCEVMAAKLVLQALVYRGCRSLDSRAAVPGFP